MLLTWHPFFPAPISQSGGSLHPPSETFGAFYEVMESDFRTALRPPSYGEQFPMYRSVASPSSATNQMPGTPVYPKVGHPVHAAVPPVGRPSPHHHPATHSPSSGLGIKVAVKPEYKITSPPRLSLHAGDLPRSNFQFDFVLERKVLTEAEKQNPNWSSFGLENLPTKGAESASPVIPGSNPIVSKYIALGLSREAVPVAVSNYGDNPTKVREFVNGYTILREMGFSSRAVADVLVLHGNNTDKALAHFLGNSS